MEGEDIIMNKEIDFSLLGIPENQIEKINNHLKNANKYVFGTDPGQTESFAWIKNKLVSLPGEYKQALLGILESNKPSFEVSYVEEGYDSCQSHRKISKTLGEAILLGGLVYEFGLLGIKINISQAKNIIKSGLTVNEFECEMLPKIAKEYGSNQDFLFPGVTPTNAETESLALFTYLALSGNPKTSVRSLTGVGGIRFDKDWNYATDFSTFVNLKIEEDKRYYPGIGIYFAMLNLDKQDVPILSNHLLSNLSESIKQVGKIEYQGVSVLCSSYIPSWSELKKVQYNAGYETIELAESFHSPAYEFSGLLSVVEKFKKNGELDKQDVLQIQKLKVKLATVWSFNSTIHLPWTSELAGLSNDLMGSITNGQGDWAIRYGVGWDSASLEVREYHFGQNRKFPGELAGKVAYSLIIYPKSDSFEGENEASDFIFGGDFWSKVKSNGFMAMALEKLKGRGSNE